MVKRKKIKGVSRPFFIIEDELDFEKGDEWLTNQDDATRLTLQVLSFQLWHDLTCRHCRGAKKSFDLDVPVVIDEGDGEDW